jgi:hypothetical protein
MQADWLPIISELKSTQPNWEKIKYHMRGCMNNTRASSSYFRTRFVHAEAARLLFVTALRLKYNPESTCLSLKTKCTQEMWGHIKWLAENVAVNDEICYVGMVGPKTKGSARRPYSLLSPPCSLVNQRDYGRCLAMAQGVWGLVDHIFHVEAFDAVSIPLTHSIYTHCIFPPPTTLPHASFGSLLSPPSAHSLPLIRRLSNTWRAIQVK